LPGETTQWVKSRTFGRLAMFALMEKTPPDYLNGERERTASHTGRTAVAKWQQFVRARRHDKTSC
jgi:hypothetical protein